MKNNDIVLFEKRSTASESTLSLIMVFLTVLSTDSLYFQKGDTFQQKRFSLDSMALSFHQQIHTHVIELSPSFNIHEFAELIDY